MALAWLLALLIVAPLLCQSCPASPQKCPRDGHGHATVSHYVLEYLKGVSELGKDVKFFGPTKTWFGIQCYEPKLVGDCVDGSSKTSTTCNILFSAINVRTTYLGFGNSAERLTRKIVNVPAKAEVSITRQPSGEPSFMQMTELTFPNLYGVLMSGYPTTAEWAQEVFSNAHLYAYQVYQENKSPGCYL
ncbi:unnamed protein product [Dibothriocephalus latus]|uniref:Transferrin-like domain-containing protein n=1 Tax=Dibothriocephalus latus TaxID=60516 RepID=A0A3P6RBP6_DIBLA|nr:unnamed protein product [Dibothriocephalus latus]